MFGSSCITLGQRKVSNTTLLPFISTKLKQMPTQAKVWFAGEVKAERTNKLHTFVLLHF